MRTEPEPRTRLVDVSRLAADAGPVLAWYEWYADPARRPLEPDDIARLVDALGPLEAYGKLDGPVGEATCVLLAGGLGYSSAEHLEALDTLDRFSAPDRASLPSWRTNPRPNTFTSVEADCERIPVTAAKSTQETAQQLPGIGLPGPSAPS